MLCPHEAVFHEPEPPPVKVCKLPEPQLTVVTEEHGLGGGQLIWKSASEISKNTLPTASTFILALFILAGHGTVIVSEPSLGTLYASSIGNVSPPSIESRMLTVGQLTGGTLVLATSHVTVCVLPTHQSTLVLGEVILNSPPADVTFIHMDAQLTPPPPG